MPRVRDAPIAVQHYWQKRNPTKRLSTGTRRRFEPMKTTHSKPTLTSQKKAPGKKRFSSNLDHALIASLDERPLHRSERITLDLTRYYRLLAEGRFALQAKFSTAKLFLILDACNGWMMDVGRTPGSAAMNWTINKPTGLILVASTID